VEGSDDQRKASAYEAFCAVRGQAGERLKIANNSHSREALMARVPAAQSKMKHCKSLA
jgi:hypothetical protein